MKMCIAWNLPLFWHFQLFTHSDNCYWFPHVSDIGDKNPDHTFPPSVSSHLPCSWWSNHTGNPAISHNGPHSLLLLELWAQCSFAGNMLISSNQLLLPLLGGFLSHPGLSFSWKVSCLESFPWLIQDGARCFSFATLWTL